MHQVGTVTFKNWNETLLNGPFVTKGLQGRLEGKKYKSVGMVFSFPAGRIDVCTQWVKEATLTKGHVLYSELMLSMTTDSSGKD